MTDIDDSIHISKTLNIPFASLWLPEKVKLREIKESEAERPAIDWISWAGEDETFPRITLDLICMSTLSDMFACKMFKDVERHVAEAVKFQADYLEFYPGNKSVITSTAEVDMRAIPSDEWSDFLELALPEVQFVRNGHAGDKLLRISTGIEESFVKSSALAALIRRRNTDFVELSSWLAVVKDSE